MVTGMDPFDSNHTFFRRTLLDHRTELLQALRHCSNENELSSYNGTREDNTEVCTRSSHKVC